MRTIMLLKDDQNKIYMKVIKSALLVLMVFFGLNVFSQNTYFSQFHNSPFTLNPALTGLSFNGSFRFITNYRYEFGYQNFETYENSLDVMIPTRKHTFGAGVQVLQDYFSNQSYAVSKISALGAYHFVLDRYGKQNLSLGAYLNTYRQVDKSLSALEDSVQVGNVVSFADYGVGAHWYNVQDRQPFLSAGMAIYKIKQSDDQKFYDDDGIHLDIFRLHLHGEARFWLNRSNSVTSRFAYYGFKNNHRVSAGVEFEHYLGLFMLGSRLQNRIVTLRRRTSIFGGIYTRIPDGIFFMVGGEIMSFRLSVSYDAYFSGLGDANSDPWYGKGYMRNAFEVTLAYKGLIAKRKSRGVRAPKLR